MLYIILYSWALKQATGACVLARNVAFLHTNHFLIDYIVAPSCGVLPVPLIYNQVSQHPLHLCLYGQLIFAIQLVKNLSLDKHPLTS